MVEILSSARLRLREIEADDAEFILELLNSQPFLDNIGDRGVRTADDARRYIENNVKGSYRRHGFGLWLIERRDNDQPLGICGLLQRDYLDFPDVGYALLPAHFGAGYATEAASAVLGYGRSVLGHAAIGAIVSPGNRLSIRVLEKIGLALQRELAATEPGQPVLLFA
jgi:ribosomal-protein-alanine N-acetyltransferase